MPRALARILELGGAGVAVFGWLEDSTGNEQFGGSVMSLEHIRHPFALCPPALGGERLPPR